MDLLKNTPTIKSTNAKYLVSLFFLTLILVPVIYQIIKGIIRKLSKGEKADYKAEIVADYVNPELSEEGLTRSGSIKPIKMFLKVLIFQ